LFRDRVLTITHNFPFLLDLSKPQRIVVEIKVLELIAPWPPLRPVTFFRNYR
jgi:hypothetical protein